GQLLIEALVRGERRRCRDQEGIAIGFRLRHQRSTDVAAAAAAVLYDDRLAPLRLQLVADDAGKHVVGAAAGIRNEKFYGSCRVPVLPERLVGPWRANYRKDEDEGEGGKPSDHGDLRRNPGLPGFRSIVRKSGRPDLRARSKDTGDKDTGDKNANATSNAVAGQGALHTRDWRSKRGRR